MSDRKFPESLVALPEAYIGVTCGESSFASIHTEQQGLVGLDISSSLAVAVRSIDGDFGYLGHFRLPNLATGDQDGLQSMLERIADEQANPELLEAIVLGASIPGFRDDESYKRFDKLIQKAREHTLDELREIIPPENISTEWLEDNRQIYSLSLDIGRYTLGFATRDMGKEEIQAEKRFLKQAVILQPTAS